MIACLAVNERNRDGPDPALAVLHGVTDAKDVGCHPAALARSLVVRREQDA